VLRIVWLKVFLLKLLKYLHGSGAQTYRSTSRAPLSVLGCGTGV
jgi:hypothetical protein